MSKPPEFRPFQLEFPGPEIYLNRQDIHELVKLGSFRTSGVDYEFEWPQTNRGPGSMVRIVFYDCSNIHRTGTGTEVYF